MTAKQSKGIYAPDGSLYITLTDGAGNLATVGSALTVGTTAITSGTSGRVLYDNAGVVGEMTNTGTGTVNVLQASPTITTPTIDRINSSSAVDLVLNSAGSFGELALGGTTILYWGSGVIFPTNGTLPSLGSSSSAPNLYFSNVYSLDITSRNAAAFINTTVNLNNGAGASVGTLSNAPSAGNPTKWIPINDNGTTRYLPAW